MVREVRDWHFVPERIRWISAVTPARAERIVAQPGQSVEPNTVLLGCRIPTFRSKRCRCKAPSEARMRLGELRVSSEGSRLAGGDSCVRPHSTWWAQERVAADTLLAMKLISLEYNNNKRG